MSLPFSVICRGLFTCSYCRAVFVLVWSGEDIAYSLTHLIGECWPDLTASDRLHHRICQDTFQRQDNHRKVQHNATTAVILSAGLAVGISSCRILHNYTVNSENLAQRQKPVQNVCLTDLTCKYHVSDVLNDIETIIYILVTRFVPWVFVQYEIALWCGISCGWGWPIARVRSRVTLRVAVRLTPNVRFKVKLHSCD
jgi:hypothetical protein